MSTTYLSLHNVRSIYVSEVKEATHTYYQRVVFRLSDSSEMDVVVFYEKEYLDAALPEQPRRRADILRFSDHHHDEGQSNECVSETDDSEVTPAER